MVELLQLSDAEYHADPAKLPSLSASIATVLVSRSPRHAWLLHPKLGGAKRKPTREMNRGSLIDALLLDRGRRIKVIQADDYRTKVARETRAEAELDGALVCLEREMDAALIIAERIREQCTGAGIVLNGISQAAVLWQEETSHGPIECRGRMDHLLPDLGIIYDLKTTKSAHPEAFRRSMIEFGYDIQWAAYTSAMRALRPDLAGREEMTFIVCEMEEPYLVVPIRPSGSMRELGNARWRRACELWARCVREDHWPGYSPGNQPIYVDAPSWALHREAENGDFESSYL